ncbi:cytochrome P450 [Pleurotus eryngii]|uniref:Cytochrome P450 n=1 Tax=Pleurotus eryngii TaxID=5323 RepID=A0A9P5ZW40_PLEER|nr:cytochrome P450 [Pleurotus eryngii]
MDILGVSFVWYCLAISACFLPLWGRHRRLQKHRTQNLRGPPSPSRLFGHVLQLNGADGLKYHAQILQRYGPIARVYGIFGEEQIYVSDPLAIRHIILTQQAAFSETPLFLSLNKMMFGNALTAVDGLEHKHERKVMNPAFSAARIKDVTPVIIAIAEELARVIERKVCSQGTFNVLDLLWRGAVDIVGQAGLGHSFQCLHEGMPNPYTESVKNPFPTLDKLKFVAPLLPYLSLVGIDNPFHPLFKLLPRNPVWELASMLHIIKSTGKQVLTARKAAIGEDEQLDILARLLKGHTQRYNAPMASPLPDEDITSQINLLMFASSETTSGALARALHQLAILPDIQSKLREEIFTCSASGVTHDNINSMLYLDAVIKETLRVYPPIVHMERVASQDVVVPLYTPLRRTDGKETSRLVIHRNQHVVIGIANCNTDTTLWGEDAHDWNPERWMNPLPQSLLRAQVPGIYSYLMSFLGGERACIGYNLAITEMKVMLAILLRCFQFTLLAVDIDWKMGSAQYPVLDGSKDPRLLLHVTKLDLDI